MLKFLARFGLFKRQYKNLARGSISENLIWLAYPTILAMFLQTSFNLVDTIFVGRISAEALAAVSMAFPLLFIVISIGAGLGISTTSLIANKLGANQKKEADNIAEHSLFITIIISVIVIIISLVFAKQIFLLMGAPISLLPTILSYFNILAFGFFFNLVNQSLSAILRGEGDTRTPTRSLFYAVLLNIILDPIFIFGLKMGVAGAAWATIIAMIFNFIILIKHIIENKSIIRFSRKDFSHDLKITNKILKLGLPSSVAYILFSLTISFLNRILSGFGVNAIAAFGLGFRFDLIAILPGFGIASALTTMAGHNLGAGKIMRVKKSVIVATIIAATLMLIIGLILFSRPEFWIFIFNKNLDVLQYGVSYIEIVALTYVFIAFFIVISAAFIGIGKSKPPLVISIVRLFVLNIPLAIILSKFYGVNGVWISIAISNIGAGIFAMFWFFKDKRFALFNTP